MNNQETIITTAYAEPFKEVRVGVKWCCPKCGILNREFDNGLIVALGSDQEIKVTCQAPVKKGLPAVCLFEYTITKRQLIVMK